MTRWLAPLAGSAVVVALIAAPVAYAFHALEQMRNFRVVREGVLYRSGQMSLGGLKRAAHDYRIRTVISLRDAASDADRAEEAWCRAQEINFHRLTPASWDAEHGPAAVEPNVRRFVEIVSDPANYPVLVHCFAGVHRTGAYCAIYRMEREGWSNAEAIAEVKACGYDNLDWEFDVLGYLEQYRPVRAATPPGSPPLP
jgi:protein tyrosine/serine phosphatase